MGVCSGKTAPLSGVDSDRDRYAGRAVVYSVLVKSLGLSLVFDG